MSSRPTRCLCSRQLRAERPRDVRGNDERDDAAPCLSIDAPSFSSQSGSHKPRRSSTPLERRVALAVHFRRLYSRRRARRSTLAHTSRWLGVEAQAIRAFTEFFVPFFRCLRQSRAPRSFACLRARSSPWTCLRKVLRPPADRCRRNSPRVRAIPVRGRPVTTAVDQQDSVHPPASRRLQ